MRTRRLTSQSDEDVRTAGELLRGGRIVAFPTETVYGLGARADHKEALRELFRVKKRPAEKRLTVLLADPEDWRRHAAELPPAARVLADAFWPGPLTLVVPDGRGAEVGLRCPDCEVARRMLRAAAVPVVAPSANLSGQPPALTAGEVLAVFDGVIAAVLDGGRARLGQASSVVRTGGNNVEILREGALSEVRIRRALGPHLQAGGPKTDEGSER